MKTWCQHDACADGLRRTGCSERLCAIHVAKLSHSTSHDGHSCDVSGFAVISQHPKTTFSNKNNELPIHPTLAGRRPKRPQVPAQSKRR